MSDLSPVLSAEEAAQVCGVSPKTVRRWVKSGRLKADKRGRSFRIQRSALVPFIGQESAHGGQPNGTVDTQDTVQDTHRGQVVPAGLYRELQAEMVRKAEAAAMWQARAEFLASELHQAREQLALIAPIVNPDEQVSNQMETAPETTPEDKAVSRASTRPWWRFW